MPVERRYVRVRLRPTQGYFLPLNLVCDVFEFIHIRTSIGLLSRVFMRSRLVHFWAGRGEAVLLDPVPSEDSLICKPDTMMFIFRLLSEGTGTTALRQLHSNRWAPPELYCRLSTFFSSPRLATVFSKLNLSMMLQVQQNLCNRASMTWPGSRRLHHWLHSNHSLQQLMLWNKSTVFRSLLQQKC